MVYFLVDNVSRHCMKKVSTSYLGLFLAFLKSAGRALWRGTVLHLSLRTGADNTAMAGRADTVIHFVVKLRKRVLLVHGGLDPNPEFVR